MKFTYRCVLGGYLAEETNIYLFALIFHFDFIYSVYLSISTMKTNNKYICSIQKGLWRSRIVLMRALWTRFFRELVQMVRIPWSISQNFQFRLKSVSDLSVDTSADSSADSSTDTTPESVARLKPKSIKFWWYLYGITVFVELLLIEIVWIKLLKIDFDN